MPKLKMTTVSLERLQLPAEGQIDYFDTAYPGLALRLTPSGVRSWVYFGRVDGRLKRATLGRYPGMSLAEARRAAASMAEAMRAGIDPATAKRRARAAAVRDSFAAVTEEWLKRDQAGNRSRDDTKRIMARYPLPVWGDRPIARITRRDCIELIDGVVDLGRLTMAHRLHGHLHRLFRWAVGRDILEVNPMTDLPRQGKLTRRDRKLNDPELSMVWRAASEMPWPFGPIYQLLILTGSRREEIGALRWSEVDGNIIRLPRERTKNDVPHTIPLCPRAAALIKELPHLTSTDLVFSTTGTTHVSNWSRAKASLDAAVTAFRGGQSLPDWHLHDMRRTVATGMERLGIMRPVIEAVLGHVGERSGIVGVYQTHTYDAEKRQALETWARHLESLVGG